MTLTKSYKIGQKINGIPYEDYPVLKKYNPVFSYHEDRISVQVYALLQDGIPVAGHTYSTPNTGGGMAPGRKWGEYDTLAEAEKSSLEMIFAEFEEDKDQFPSHIGRLNKAIKAIAFRLTELRDGKQTSLF